jgi:hypothetical protein
MADQQQAKKEFLEIKTALIGPTKEWCLPNVDEKAKASNPMIDQKVLDKLIAVCDESIPRP